MKAHENPFRKERIERFRYQISPPKLQELAQQFWQMGGKAAIVGAKGTGKTTLMEDLRALLEASIDQSQWIYLYLGMDKKEKCRLVEQAFTAPKDTLIFIDGGETLSFWQWLRLRRCRCNLLTTLHKPSHLPTLYHAEKKLFCRYRDGDRVTGRKS